MLRKYWAVSGLMGPVLAGALSLGATAPAAAMVFSLGAPTLAAGAALSADREAVVRGLEAQYAATLIRERKLADDRETKLLDAAEARLAKARSETATVKRESQGALEQARADYAKLAGDLAHRDAAAKAEVEAYRADAEQRVAQATPEELAALQQFADGDRKVAEPILMAIREARKRATLAAAQLRIAQDERATADEHDIMRLHGEATTTEVQKLYDQAAEDDPNDFKTNLMLGRLATEVHDYRQSLDAYQKAVATARNDPEREAGYLGLGNAQLMTSSFAEAGLTLQRALDISLKLAATDPKSVAAATDLANCWSTIGTVRRAKGDRDGALAAYRSALAAAGRADASSPKVLYQLAEANEKIGDLEFEAGDAKAALANHQEELTLGRRAEALDPDAVAARRYQGRALDRIGDAQQALGDVTAALASFKAHNGIFEKLAAADPTSVYFQQEIAAGYGRIGGTLYRGRDFKGALEIFKKQLDLNQTLAAQHPDSVSLQIAVAIGYVNFASVQKDSGDAAAAAATLHQAVAIARALASKDPNAIDAQMVIASGLFNLAAIPDSGVSWDEVVAQYQAMKDRGQLRADMQADFDRAKGCAANPKDCKE